MILELDSTLFKFIKRLVGAGIIFFVFLLLACSKNSALHREITDGIAKYQYFEDASMWNHIYHGTDAFFIPEAVAPKAIIIPHHDITTGNQNSFYKALSYKMQPSVIVVVAPDHFEMGQKLITMPENTTFMAPEGNLEVDADLISRISGADRIKDVVSLQSDLWFQEHGIFIHTPFLKHYFPQAKFVPILAKMLTTDQEFESFEKLGQVLAEVLPEDALVVASVDFSHYQIPLMTSFHDRVSQNTIQCMEDPRYAEIDSPESIQVIFSYCKAKKADKPVLINRSSTYDYIPDEYVESTSHQYWCFYDDSLDLLTEYDYFSKVPETNQRYNESIDARNQTILIGGSGKTEAGIRTTWKWDRYNTATDPADILLRDVAGKEARFLYGFDAVIMDPEVGTTYERTLHNTTLTVDTISMKDFQGKYKSIFAEAFDKSFGDMLLPVLKKFFTSREVKVLEVVMSTGFTQINKETVKYALTQYDVVVFRDNEGKVDGKAYMMSADLILKEYNLGIIHGEGKIKGSLLAIDFYKGGTTTATFDYESDTGVVPAIYQFIPEE